MLIDWLKGTVVATLPLLAGAISLGAQQAARSDSTPPDTLHPYAVAPVVVTASRLPASPLGRGERVEDQRREPELRQAADFEVGAADLPG